jgi:hypothetical protein
MNTPFATISSQYDTANLANFEVIDFASLGTADAAASRATAPWYRIGATSS